MKQIFLSLTFAILAFSAQVFARGIRAVSPAEGSVQVLHNDMQLRYFAMPLAERRVYFADEACRKEMASAGFNPKPVTLKWEADGVEAEGPYKVTVSYDKDFAEGTCYTYITKDIRVDVDNLRIATTYYWKVQKGDEISPVSTFVTSSQPPRMLRIPKMWSVRDLGGRVGLDGRRIKQDMVIRSGALNCNATKTEKCDEEGKPIYTPGPCVLTDEGMNYILNVLKLKTEIDLRSDEEVMHMTGSPAGDSVTWLHYSSSHYDGMQYDFGKKPFIEVFKVFLDEKNYPIDFHCIGGQDRTGSVAFILEALLGVEENELYLDWECTGFWNPQVRFNHENHFDKLVNGFDKFPGDTIYERVENYVISLGFTKEDIQHFRNIMLE